ncbi:DUF2939 domain-containing protein [Thiocystis minor]|uniref:DUF2939 domain-containing protein n=1 Tax=Thiocystis minor TaxID=61597 RepID=UPI0019148EEA|nr:DUF2939 domain-containing protein [Thiocystis minor]
MRAREKAVLLMPALARSRHRIWVLIRHWWRLARRSVRRLSILGLALVILYGLWPYATLWRLNRALAQGDETTLEQLVDLDAIREELARRLNKERVSAIDGLSDNFIEWLELGIRHHGIHALEHSVTLDWVREQLTSRRLPKDGSPPIPAVGFFENPRYFRVRIGQRNAQPVILRLHLDRQGWRVSTLYY